MPDITKLNEEFKAHKQEFDAYKTNMDTRLAASEAKSMEYEKQIAILTAGASTNEPKATDTKQENEPKFE